MTLVACRECKTKISGEAKTCPHCGVAKPGQIVSDQVFGLAATVVVGVLAWAYFSGNEKSTAPLSSCAKDWHQCADNTALVNQYLKWTMVPAECKSAATKQARYGTPIWPWAYFGSFYPGTDFVTSGQVTLFEPDAQFQNAFGAQEHSRVMCQYDLAEKRVVLVNVTTHQ
jgi:hypothetical protein